MKLSFNFLHEWVEPWRAYVSEFLGTFLFVFLASVLVVVSKIYDLDAISMPVGIASIYTALIFATLHLSGGFLNPAITVSLWIAKKLTTSKAIFFIISQLAAGIAATFLVVTVFGGGVYDFAQGAPVLGLGISGDVAMLFEAIFTAGLVFVVFATIIDKRGFASLGPLAIGFFLIGAELIASPLTGGIFNPARVIGATVLGRDFELISPFIVGPFVGSLFGLFYEYVFLTSYKKK
ncbi:MAG: aquaporin [Patescibacteria group bacterium]